MDPKKKLVQNLMKKMHPGLCKWHPQVAQRLYARVFPQTNLMVRKSPTTNEFVKEYHQNYGDVMVRSGEDNPNFQNGKLTGSE